MHGETVMEPNAYTTTQVAKISGATPRQLTYWSTHGIIAPSIQSSFGPGTRRLYSFDDLIKLHFLGRLKDMGWSLQKIRAAITNLHIVMDDPDPLKSAMLVGGKKNILALYKTKEGERHLVEASVSGGQHVLSIALETIEEETRAALARFASNSK